MKELDLLKKDWQKSNNSFEQVSEIEIYKMIHKKNYRSAMQYNLYFYPIKTKLCHLNSTLNSLYLFVYIQICF